MAPTADRPHCVLKVFPLEHYLYCIASQGKTKPGPSWHTLVFHFHYTFPSSIISFWPIHLNCLFGYFFSNLYPRDSVPDFFLFSLNALPLLVALFNSFDCKSLNWPILNLFPDLSSAFLTHIINIYHSLFTQMFQRSKNSTSSELHLVFFFHIKFPHKVITLYSVSLKCPMLTNYPSFFSFFRSKLWSPQLISLKS